MNATQEARQPKGYGRVCQCSDPGCPATIEDTGKHRQGIECQDPATLHLKRIDMEDVSGLDFCDACGDDALASGVFA